MIFHININNKKYISFDEQVAYLKSKNLTINDEEKLKKYLKRYNYQIVIDGYSTDFFINQDRNNKFIANASSDDIINLFEFDKWIGNFLFAKINDIERRLNTAITHEILKELNNCLTTINYPINAIIPIYDVNEIYLNKYGFSLGDLLYKNVFSEIKLSKSYSSSFFINNCFDKKWDVNEAIKEAIFEANFIKPKNKSYFYFKRYKSILDIISIAKDPLNEIKLIKQQSSFYFNFDEKNKDLINKIAVSLIPIYKTFTSLSFSELIKVFLILKSSIKNRIIEEYFPEFNLIAKRLRKIGPRWCLFEISIEAIINLRNIIDHNKVIFKSLYLENANKNSCVKTYKILNNKKNTQQQIELENNLKASYAYRIQNNVGMWRKWSNFLYKNENLVKSSKLISQIKKINKDFDFIQDSQILTFWNIVDIIGIINDSNLNEVIEQEFINRFQYLNNKNNYLYKLLKDILRGEIISS